MWKNSDWKHKIQSRERKIEKYIEVKFRERLLHCRFKKNTKKLRIANIKAKIID